MPGRAAKAVLLVTASARREREARRGTGREPAAGDKTVPSSASMASSEASERGHGGERRAPYNSTGRGAPRAHGGRGAPRRGTPRRGTPRRGCAGVVGRGGARRRGVVGGGVLRRERVREAPCTACASNSDAPSHVTHTHTCARAHISSAAKSQAKVCASSGSIFFLLAKCLRGGSRV